LFQSIGFLLLADQLAVERQVAGDALLAQQLPLALEVPMDLVGGPVPLRAAGRGVPSAVIVQVRIRLGSGLARLAPAPMLTLELPEGATVGELYDSLGASHPELAPALRSALAVLGGSQLERGRPLRHGDEVALLLPVAGGGRSGTPPTPGRSSRWP
jgi:molybdopterin converting factor small subunit